MKRTPVVAGQFYPGSVDKLTFVLDRLMAAHEGEIEAKAVILPHAGYIYSGRTAGATIAKVRIPATVILLGPNHTGLGVPFSIMESGTWETPIGDVEIDNGTALAIMEKADDVLQADFYAHRHEHSLEVLLPFLRYKRPDVKIVPIAIMRGSYREYDQLGRAIARTIEERGDILIVVSSDMTHYESEETVRAKDNLAIKQVEALSPRGLLDVAMQNNITMCGVIPSAIALIAATELGAKSAELVAYSTSGDTSGDRSSVVGYAGIIIR